jgi:hypothetical protein
MSESEVLREASQILLQHLSPAKVARFWASWHVGKGDYLAWRDEEFDDETVSDLYDKVRAFQDSAESETK